MTGSQRFIVNSLRVWHASAKCEMIITIHETAFSLSLFLNLHIRRRCGSFQVMVSVVSLGRWLESPTYPHHVSKFDSIISVLASKTCVTLSYTPTTSSWHAVTLLGDWSEGIKSNSLSNVIKELFCITRIKDASGTLTYRLLQSRSIIRHDSLGI